MQLLEHSDLPVAMIARETGYNEPAYFSRLFKEKVGVNPLRYRNRCKTN